MKKIVFVVLMAFLVIGCGKTEKGVMTIENKSAYTVELRVDQNYLSKNINLEPNASTECNWEKYILCMINKPDLNLIKYNKTKDKMIIFNNDDLYKATVHNFLDCPITLQDNQKYIFADEKSKNWLQEITIDAKKLDQPIYLFNQLVKSNIIIKETSQKLVYDKIEYTYEIKKIKDVYCLKKTWETEDKDTHVKTSHLKLYKINMELKTIVAEKKEEYIIIISLS